MKVDLEALGKPTWMARATCEYCVGQRTWLCRHGHGTTEFEDGYAKCVKVRVDSGDVVEWVVMFSHFRLFDI